MKSWRWGNPLHHGMIPMIPDGAIRSPGEKLRDTRPLILVALLRGQNNLFLLIAPRTSIDVWIENFSPSVSAVPRVLSREERRTFTPFGWLAYPSHMLRHDVILFLRPMFPTHLGTRWRRN